MAKLTITQVPVPTPPRTFTLELDEAEATLIQALTGRVARSKAAARIYGVLMEARLKPRKFVSVAGAYGAPHLEFTDPE